MPFDPSATALVITDPQNDFLSPDGAAWDLVGDSVTDNGTVDNLQRLLAAAKAAGVPVFVSPHYYYPVDEQWQFGGQVEKLMHDIDMFTRKGPLDLEGFDVTVVKDATAVAQHPELGDGYEAAVVNFGFIAGSVVTTDDAIDSLS